MVIMVIGMNKSSKTEARPRGEAAPQARRAPHRMTPLAVVKAKLSKYVDDAEHHGKIVIISRHGKPAAVIVPVSVGVPQSEVRGVMAPDEIRALFDRLEQQGDQSVSAVDDLISGRR
jgi:prevent-host-death family protein